MSATKRKIEYDDNDEYGKRARLFVAEYSLRAKEAIAAEDTSNITAADANIALSTMTFKFLRDNEGRVGRRDVLFLRREAVARCLQALLLYCMTLCGFGDLSVSNSSFRKLEEDLRNARRRIEEGREGSQTNDRSDPRVETAGLYEYIPYEKLDVSLDDLPGYELQHRRILNAYYVINERPDDAMRSNNVTDGKRPNSRSGANLILYGPPGTGKTAAARAAARSLGLNLAFVNAENLLSSYRSETEKNLRLLYDKMRSLVRITGRNVVLLMDEIDGLVKNRKSGNAVNSGDYSLLTRFLTILEPNDGTDNYGIFSVFTTNKISNLDDAFRRRCSSILYGYVLDSEARERLIDVFLGDSVDMSSVTQDFRNEILRVCATWVPGDFARFKRETVKPLRLNEFLRNRGKTEEQFFAEHNRAAIATNAANAREISVSLPVLHTETLLRYMKLYRPVTPPDKYGEYTDDSQL